MTRTVRAIVICSYLFVPLMAFVCPSPTHYPLGCTLCLSFSSSKSTQFVANQTCRSQGGALLTVDKELEWRVFQLYLESLNLNASKIWVGYRLGEGGKLNTNEWKTAPYALVESMQRSLAARGEFYHCVTVEGDEMVSTECSKKHRYVCIFSYPAPTLVASNPHPGPVFHSPPFTLSLEASFSGSAITATQWRRLKAIEPDLIWKSDKKKTGQNKWWAQLNVTSERSNSYWGHYQLLVTNPAGTTLIASWKVQPASLGNFTRTPQDLTIPEGSIAYFECLADDAVPTPTYTWWKGENPVVIDQTRIYMSNITHTLLVRDVGQEDTGGYSCRVENIAGVLISPQATLTVRPQHEFIGSPYFLLHPRNITMTEGSLFSVECVALHTAAEVFYVMRLGGEVSPLNYPAATGAPLLTSPIFKSELSVCYVGTQNLTKSNDGFLTVLPLPYVNPLVTPFGNDTGPHSIPINNTNTTMKCLFAGIPLPSQKWYFNGVHVGPKRASSDASSDEGEVTSELGLKQVSGVYQCYISNPYGTVFSSTTLCVQNLPGPTPFSVVADSTTSLYVTWSPPQPPSLHPLLLRYEVLTTYTLTNATFSSGTLLPSSSPWVVKGLNASTQYRVRVKSWSPLGQGADGEEQMAYTYGPAPRRSPLDFLNVTVSRTHQNQGLVVQWHLTLPPPLGTLFSYYQVQYRMVGDEGEGLTEQADATQSWVFIDQLENAQNFEIRLRVKVQVQRYPAEYDHTPWTVWMPVEGVITFPPTPSSLPTVTPSVRPNSPVEKSDREEVLLVAVLVPVLSLLVILVVILVTVGGWKFWTRATQSYSPRKKELRQVPMGKDVFFTEENVNKVFFSDV